MRGLKVKIAVSGKEVSLAPASDLILREVGRGGFAGVKSCRVGVPVASAVVSSRKSSNAGNSSSDGSGKKEAKKEKSKNERNEKSLAEMMKDQSAASDGAITNMVARVGRWWYTRCYEREVVSGSVWDDERVLEECERWGTSFKLLVCYAQKPETTSV